MARASPSPSSSSRSSVTPPPTITASSSKKKSQKTKSAPADAGKNEGVDLSWAYTPPSGVVRVGEEDVDAGEFDWETLKNDPDLELWLIRVPESIKPKHLDKLEVILPASKDTACIGTLNRKHANFDVWAIGDNDELPVGGEEIKSLSCLLPRKGKKGKFYPEPKPIARHIIVSAQAIRPTTTTPIAHQNPPRFSYPKEVLKHKYVPFGSVDATSTAEDADAMAVDAEPSSPKKSEKASAPDAEPEVKGKKGKKRKGDAEAAEAPPKKSKKSKVA